MFNCIVAAFSIALAVAPKPIELEAEAWFNPHTVRLPDDRSYVVLFFSTVQGEKKTAHLLRELEKLRTKRGVVVMALSPQSPKTIEKFVKEKHIRFPVGAQSKAYRQFQVKRFPALVVLDGGEPVIYDDVPLLSVDDLHDYLELSDNGDTPPPASGDFDKESDVALLQTHARSNPDQEERNRALDLLRGKMNNTAFMKLCDELLAGTEPGEGGFISYEKHLADPNVKEKQPRRAPSVVASHARRANPDGPEWQRVREYESAIVGSPRTLEELMNDFFAYQSEPMDPQNLLIRRDIAGEFIGAAQNGSQGQKAVARDLVMQMLPTEPDAAMRLYLMGALNFATSPGDLEVAEFLEEQLKTEPDIRFVRPSMERVIHCLRTGEGPCYDD